MFDPKIDREKKFGKVLKHLKPEETLDQERERQEREGEKTKRAYQHPPEKK